MSGYRQRVAFIDRKAELKFLDDFIDKEPSEILFVHGPKSSGKTTLLNKFFGQVKDSRKLDVRFLNLREKLIIRYEDFLETFFGLNYHQAKEDIKETREYSLPFFKLKAEELKGLKDKKLDPFEVLKKEFVRQTRKGIRPVLIIDELQALAGIYMNSQRELIKEMFNFFVAMTKESHLAHIIIASSDGYFIERIYNDSKLGKASNFFKIDYHKKKDVFDWLLNLEKYSIISEYTLNHDQAEKIWDALGGCAWEIQLILTELFHKDIDEALEGYKKIMKAKIIDYVAGNGRTIKEEILKKVISLGSPVKTDFTEEELPFLAEMVSQNILFYDPSEAAFYPQGKSYEWGIRLYLKTNLLSASVCPCQAVLYVNF